MANAAHANGRMPGANDVLFHARDPQALLARATFGLVQTHDGAASWSWICEQAIDVSGVVADPPLALLENGSLLLLPPTGSALLSSDHGCSWARVAEPLANKRGVDLTLDPSDAKHLLLLMSTLSGVDDKGFGVYQNELFETRDNALSFTRLALLPSDFEAETLEIAKSDDRRIYVSGTAANNPRLGLLFRSDDAGAHFERSELALPAGTGSLFISAIHPRDADRLWLRVPARGDTIGILPARLYLSTDKGQTFRLLASTQRAMFGLALSPDGEQLAYGGPSDGLYVGASDGASGFQKENNLSVRCLRWNETGLYACASEPADSFSLGLSTDQGKTFRPLYKLANTCPQACEATSAVATRCEQAWTVTGPLIGVPPSMCRADQSPEDSEAGAPKTDAGQGDAEPEPEPEPEPDPEQSEPDANANTAESNCGCRLTPTAHSEAGPFLACLMLSLFAVRRSAARSP